MQRSFMVLALTPLWRTVIGSQNKAFLTQMLFVSVFITAMETPTKTETGTRDLTVAMLLPRYRPGHVVVFRKMVEGVRTSV